MAQMKVRHTYEMESRQQSACLSLRTCILPNPVCTIIGWIALIVTSGLCFGVTVGSAADKTKIAFFTGVNGPANSVLRAGAEAAASRLNVQFEWHTSTSPEDQILQIERAVEQGVSGLAVLPLDMQEENAKIDYFNNKVAVVIVDGDARYTKYLAVGMDDQARGALVMNELAKGISDKDLNGLVAILGGPPWEARIAQRVEGAKREAARHPIIKIQDVYPSRDTAVETASVVLNAWKKNSEICGWAMVWGWSLFSQPNALAEAPPKVFVVVYDDFMDSQISYVRSRVVGVLLVDDFYSWGPSPSRCFMTR